MNTELWTTGQVAAALGTTVPRVLRTVRRMHLPSVRRGNRTLLDEAARRTLLRELGAGPTVEGFSRHDLRVLAALARAPRGLASQRAVGRRAGVSAATAGTVLERLVDTGLAARRRVRMALGRVTDIEVWGVVRTHPTWQTVASQVGQVVLPAVSQARADRRPRRLPSRLAHVFWSTPIYQLYVEQDALLIASRILSIGDLEALAWAIDHLPSSVWRSVAVGARGLDPQVRSLAQALGQEW